MVKLGVAATPAICYNPVGPYVMRAIKSLVGAWRSLASAPEWGSGGREFKSRRSDQFLYPIPLTGQGSVRQHRHVESRCGRNARRLSFHRPRSCPSKGGADGDGRVEVGEASSQQGEKWRSPSEYGVCHNPLASTVGPSAIIVMSRSCRFYSRSYRICVPNIMET